MDDGGETAAERQLKRAAEVFEVWGSTPSASARGDSQGHRHHKGCFLLLDRCTESEGTEGEEGESTTRCRPARTGAASSFAS